MATWRGQAMRGVREEDRSSMLESPKCLLTEAWMSPTERELRGPAAGSG